MQNHPPFICTWKWHLKVLGIFVCLCTLAFYIFSYISNQLPAAYQHRTATPQTTPWLHTEVTP